MGEQLLNRQETIKLLQPLALIKKPALQADISEIPNEINEKDNNRHIPTSQTFIISNKRRICSRIDVNYFPIAEKPKKRQSSP